VKNFGVVAQIATGGGIKGLIIDPDRGIIWSGG
jgi:hypothetical protein